MGHKSKKHQCVEFISVFFLSSHLSASSCHVLCKALTKICQGWNYVGFQEFLMIIGKSVLQFLWFTCCYLNRQLITANSSYDAPSRQLLAGLG